MREKDFLKNILDRLACLDGISNIFTADEVANWPDGALEALKAQALLVKTEPTQIIECQGCEQNCMMPVQVIPSEDKRPTRAFIVCDKRDDIGRVHVKLERLTEWKITGQMLALKLAEILGFEQDPKEKQRNKLWELGVLKGKANRPHLTLKIENGVSLKVGVHEIPLLDVLSFKKNKLSLDVDELFRLADRSPKNLPKYKPSDLKREARKLKTNELHKSWQKKYRELKTDKPNMSGVWYSQQIAKQFGNKYSPETIRKNMKP